MEVFIIILLLASLLYFVILIGWAILSAVWEAIWEAFTERKESGNNKQRYTH